MFLDVTNSGSMKIYLNGSEWHSGTGMFRSLAGIDRMTIGSQGDGTATDYDGMVSEAKTLAGIAPNIVIKLPCIEAGIRACKTLSDGGVRANMTLCFQPLQALVAAKAGAFLISPFVGRIDDIGGDGMEIIQQIRQIYDNYGFETKILTASIRHPQHMVQAAMIGSDVATCPFKVIQQVTKHPLTDIGLKRFLEDWEKAGAALRNTQAAMA